MTTVLLVDDDAAVRKALSKTLRQTGLTVVVAQDGRDALAKLHEQEVHAVVSDVRMPHMDGMQFFEALCRGRPDLSQRVLFITAWSHEAPVTEFLKRSSCPFLAKPFEMSEFLEAVRTVIGGEASSDRVEGRADSPGAAGRGSITYLPLDAERTRKSGVGQVGKRRPSVERRAKPRSARQNAATNVVQAIVRDPSAAAEELLRDLEEGADPDVVLGLLDAAEAALALRGVSKSTTIEALRSRISRHIQ